MISQADNSGIPEHCPDRRSTKLRCCRWGWRSWCFFNCRSVNWCFCRCCCWCSNATASAAAAVAAAVATTVAAVSACGDGTTIVAAGSGHDIAARVAGAGTAAASRGLFAARSWCRSTARCWLAAALLLVAVCLHRLAALVPSTCFCRAGQQHGCQREDHSKTSHDFIPSIELLPARNPTDEPPQTPEKRFQTA